MVSIAINKSIRSITSRTLGALRGFSAQPFERGSQFLIFHACHHRAGTVWFGRILRAVAKYYSLPFVENDQSAVHKSPSMFLHEHSRIDFSSLPRPYRGSHIVRDPRDIVVSGYYYHLWTSEPWANMPLTTLRDAERFSMHSPDIIGQMTYKQYLNSLSRAQGLLVEIRRASLSDLREMITWNYHDNDILELRYEDVIRDEQAEFQRLFKHYGFTKRAINKSLEIAESFSFKNATGRRIGEVEDRSHMRSGGIAQWKNEFNASHKRLFKELYGEDLIRLGYENTTRW